VIRVKSDRYHNRIDFYARTLRQWIPDRLASILVVGGGQNDADVFSAAGFRNVTFTNLKPPAVVTQGPFTTVAADAENLPFPDGTYDYTVAHAVLHHCRSPHRAMLELYRVAKQAAVAFEARDSAVMRFAERIGAGNPYEVSSVEANGGIAGGVRDKGVPNYVYRWTEREVEKTIASFAPHAHHRINWAYGFGTPVTPTRAAGGGWCGASRGWATGPWPCSFPSSETCSRFASRSRCCRATSSHG
jgi:SAM-dependent methyltransferase